MPRNTSPEHRTKFYLKYGTELDECEKLGNTAHSRSPQCRELVKIARVHFGYSLHTASLDLYRPLIRGYRKWKAKAIADNIARGGSHW